MGEFIVVGCTDCSSYWVLKGDQETTTCRGCGRQHQMRKLRTFIETDSKAVARERRAELLAEQAGYGDEYRDSQDHFD